MTVQTRWQTTLFTTTVLLAIVSSVAIELTVTQQILLLAPIVAVLGLPHGALDLPIAEMLWPLKGWRGKLRFAIFYLGLTALVIALWLAVPGLALCAFLAYSALHFADDWQNSALPLRWTGGLATVGAPALFHRSDVTTLFTHLASAPAPASQLTHSPSWAAQHLSHFWAALFCRDTAGDGTLPWNSWRSLPRPCFCRPWSTSWFISVRCTRSATSLWRWRKSHTSAAHSLQHHR